MTRPEAEELIVPYIIMVDSYRAIKKENLPIFLSEEKLLKLEQDKIRNLGPTKDTIYPWNVVDYITLELKV